MGIPKFYRWISERYPCLSQVVKEHQIPEFDNLYLDMNGIIHQCSHPNDEDVHFRISEQKIFADVFHYIEVLFRIIKPRKVFFMAVDGVAPRAKMNQQRGRRFRSAKEAEEKVRKAVEKGELLPTEARFDSNCITPGTDFMARLQDQLRYFVHCKISSDRSWQGVRVYLSGHETPGEGEHKIMEFIRCESAKHDHDPNTRHCLYGLDADLIMLGLVSHEPHFSLLREEVRFGGKRAQKRITTPEETTFHLLHLSLMREYIDYEFYELRSKLTFAYDLERIIDDWILMGFLVGNDFIPHLPNLHITQDALPLLYRTYITVLPQLGGYINENGNLNLAHFEKYLEKLSEFDRESFSDVFVDLKWFESKVGNRYLNEAAGQAAEESFKRNERKGKGTVDAALGLTALEGVDTARDEECEEEDMFETEFRQYKRTYYMSKMEVEVVSEDFLVNQAQCYVEGIQWILHYYYHGVQSWSWYYPYHYAPFLSDIRNIGSVPLTFHKGEPFLPFQQLLAVLPAASKELLPECYQHLMTSEASPIIEYYPLDFRTDLNGKQQEWEAVVLIPFIDEEKLLAAMQPYNELLKPGEKERNKHSECSLYQYDRQLDFTYCSALPEHFPHLPHCHVREALVAMDAWQLPLEKVRCSVDRGMLYFCGFPTLKHIPHTFYRKKSGVVVFQQSSRGENMILEILRQAQDLECECVAAQVLGRGVYVNWPHLEEARVVGVSDGEIRLCLEEMAGVQKVFLCDSPPPSRATRLSDKEQKEWMKEVQGLTEHFQKRKGVCINETEVLLHVQLLTGLRYVVTHSGEVRLEKQWAKQVLLFPYQTVVKNIKAFELSFPHFRTLEELFPPATTVFMLGSPYYGSMGEVQDSSDVIGEGRVRVVFCVPCEPQLEALIQSQHKYSVKYSPGYVLASRLGITGYLVSRFSGSIFIGRGSKRNPHGEHRANVGLNLKFNKKNEEVPGYSKRTEKEWLYSAAVEELLSHYLEKFPEVFDYVSKNSQDDVFYEDDIWSADDENGAEKVQEIMSWLKTHPVSSSSRASCDLQILDNGIVEKIEEELEKAKLKKSNKKVRVTVKPHLLFRPLEQQQGVTADPEAEFRLFDRVVNVRENFSVPLGLRGTVIGIKGADRDTEVLYEVLFDEEFPGGLTIRCSHSRGYRLPTSALINLSHGVRLESGSHKLTAIVKPQPSSLCSQRAQLTGLNHSPRSPFIPTQGSKQTLGKSNSLKNAAKARGREEEFFNVWQSLHGSPMPQKPSTQQHSLGGDGSIRLLKRNEDFSSLDCTGSRSNKASSEFEGLIANLKISKPAQNTDEPLSPQSFALKGTLMLKEMLKIDGSVASVTAPSLAPDSAPSCISGPAPLGTTDSMSPVPPMHGRRKPSKNLAARIHRPQAELLAPPTSGTASDLARLCMGLGMAPPEFTFLRTPQGLTVCQVKLSSGLLVHGPQCHTEAEAKDKAALFALQRLGSVGCSFPLVQPLFAGVRPASLPPVFNQTTGGLLLQSLPWPAPLPQAQHFYPTPHLPLPTAHMASHHQFVPLQVTKKRAMGRKAPQDCSSTPSARPSQSNVTMLPHKQTTPVEATPTPATPTSATPRHAPAATSKRKTRKLAVNFEAAKVSE